MKIRHEYFYKILFSVIIFIITFIVIMTSYNLVVKKKYIYNINNYYTGIPNSIEYYQNEDQKKIGKTIQITNDENGFRNKKNSIYKKDILFLGDSLIRGMNTDDEKLLSNIINKKIYNAGMDGFSTFNSVNVAKDLYKKKKFKKIILFFSMNNDFRDNVFQTNYEKNFKHQIMIKIKNNQFLNDLLKVRFLFQSKNDEKMNISEINKNYFHINFLKLLINEKKFVNISKKETLIAFKNLKDLSLKNNAQLIIVGIPNISEVFKDIDKILDLKNELLLEKLLIEDFRKKVDFNNPKKVFFSVCEKAKIKCAYVPLDEKSFHEIDYEHWNSHGQEITKNYLIKHLNMF